MFMVKFGQILKGLARQLLLWIWLIAAHAVWLGITLVTNNTREFARVTSLNVIDWIN